MNQDKDNLSVLRVEQGAVVETADDQCRQRLQALLARAFAAQQQAREVGLLGRTIFGGIA